MAIINHFFGISCTIVIILVAISGLSIYCVNKNAFDQKTIAEQYEELVATPEQKIEKRRNKIKNRIANRLKDFKCSKENCLEGAEFALKLDEAGSPKSLEEVLDQRFTYIDLNHHCNDIDISKRKFEFCLEGKYAKIVFIYICKHGVWTLTESWYW